MSHSKQIDLSKIKRIHVSVLKYHGDVLLTSPLFTTLKRALPEAEIDVSLYKETLPILEGHPAINQFFVFDPAWKKHSFLKKAALELSVYYQIRKKKYDLVIVMTACNRGSRGVWTALASGAPIRVGKESAKALNNAVFTHLIRATPTPKHMVELNYNSLRGIGLSPLQGHEQDLFFHIPEAARQSISRRVPYEDFVLIHPTSRSDFKDWPAEKFASLIHWLRQKGENIVISGGADPKEIERTVSIIGNQKVLNLAGQTTIKELGALIEKTKLLITVDSVPMHLACALKKPLVAIFGPSDDIKWGPWQNPFSVVVRLDLPCKRCSQEGCGGTGISECLRHLPLTPVIDAISNLNPH
jgi:heptosyltransferase III